MGCGLSKTEAERNEIAKRIDKQLRDEMKVYHEQIKLLLLGAGESGKSTIAKQMVILHKEGYPEKERKKFKSVIHTNTLQSITSLIRAMKALEIPYDNDNCKDAETKLLTMQASGDEDITTEGAAYIKLLWDDAGIQRCLKRANEFQLEDSAEYYLNEIERITQPDYIPTQQDILRTRVKTTGIIEIRFSFKEVQFLMVDVGGQRTERRKWIHCFEGVTAIIFTVALSGYDQVLREDEEVNRMHESMVLFDSTCNNTWFSRTSMILFLNKKDIFETKIQKSPLKHCFPDYTGNNEYEEALVFIRTKFELLNQHPETKEIYSHFTCATDTKNIEVVFDAVADVITQSNMKEIGLI